MKPVLIDTGFIVSLLDRSQSTHSIAKEVFSSIQQPLITCEAVIAESCYLLRKVSNAHRAIFDNIASGILQIPWHLQSHETEIASLLAKYSKVPMDLADACLVCMANIYNTGQILTFDSDFEIYRWRKNKVFKINQSN